MVFLMTITLCLTFTSCKNDKNKYIPLAQHVVGTYSGKLSANYRTVEDAYIVKVIELTDKTVQVQASFFSTSTHSVNYNLTESNGQILFVNTTYDYVNIVYNNGTLTINYVTTDGELITYAGRR